MFAHTYSILPHTYTRQHNHIISASPLTKYDIPSYKSHAAHVTISRRPFIIICLLSRSHVEPLACMAMRFACVIINSSLNSNFVGICQLMAMLPCSNDNRTNYIRVEYVRVDCGIVINVCRLAEWCFFLPMKNTNETAIKRH